MFDNQPRGRSEVGKMTCVLCDFRLTKVVLTQTSPSIRHTYVCLLIVGAVVYVDSQLLYGKVQILVCMYGVQISQSTCVVLQSMQDYPSRYWPMRDPPSSGSQQRPSHVRGTDAPKAAMPIRGNSGGLLPRLVNFCPHRG